MHPRSRKFRGKILAKFILITVLRDEGTTLLNNVKEMLSSKEKFDLSMGVIGVRNLPTLASKPNLEVNVCGMAGGSLKMEMDEAYKFKKTANPSFFKIKTLDDIQLPRDLILWPLVEIRVKYSKLIGEEALSTTFPLVYYNDDGRDEEREGSLE